MPCLEQESRPLQCKQTEFLFIRNSVESSILSVLCIDVWLVVTLTFDYDRMTVVDENMLQGEWVSMGVTSDGSYGIEKDLIYSFPVQITPDHKYTIVQGLEINDFAREKMDATMKELIQERDDAIKACQE